MAASMAAAAPPQKKRSPQIRERTLQITNSRLFEVGKKSRCSSSICGVHSGGACVQTAGHRARAPARVRGRLLRWDGGGEGRGVMAPTSRAARIEAHCAAVGARLDARARAVAEAERGAAEAEALAAGAEAELRVARAERAAKALERARAEHDELAAVAEAEAIESEAEGAQGAIAEAERTSESKASEDTWPGLCSMLP